MRMGNIQDVLRRFRRMLEKVILEADYSIAKRTVMQISDETIFTHEPLIPCFKGKGFGSG